MCVRFSSPGRNYDDLDIFTHSNDTLAALRRTVLRRVKAAGPNVKLELFVNGDLLDPADDRKMLSQIPLRDKAVSLPSCLKRDGGSVLRCGARSVQTVAWPATQPHIY